jgi:hypothetical protein
LPTGAAIAGIASIGSAVIGSNAASSAANAQATAQNNALTAQNANFNSGLQFQKDAFGTAQTALNPFINSGSSVLPTLQSLLTPGPSQTATLSQLPGFQFQSQYGTLATTNALAARGLGGSTGPLVQGISNYNQGLAGTSFSSLVNALQAYGNMGTTAAGSLANAAGTAGANVGTLTANTNNTIGTTNTNIGNANASGILGSANAVSGGLTGASNTTTNALILSKLLGGSATGAGAGSGGGIYGTTQAASPTGLSTTGTGGLY